MISYIPKRGAGTIEFCDSRTTAEVSLIVVRAPHGIVFRESTKSFGAAFKQRCQLRTSLWWPERCMRMRNSFAHAVCNALPGVSKRTHCLARMFNRRRRNVVCWKVTADCPPANIAGRSQALNSPNRHVGHDMPSRPDTRASGDDDLRSFPTKRLTL